MFRRILFWSIAGIAVSVVPISFGHILHNYVPPPPVGFPIPSNSRIRSNSKSSVLAAWSKISS